MRNILALIHRFYLFLLFLALQSIALVILFKNNNFQRAEFIRHSSDWVGGIYSQRAQLSEYLRLGEINDQLSLENAQLRSQMPVNYGVIRSDLDSILDSVSFQRYFFRTAKVVNASVNREDNFITLDRGWSGGVAENMGVISGGCIVGVVRSVSEHFSVVMPVLHSDFKASVKLKKSGFFGSLIWPGGNAAIANVIEIPKNIPVAYGDTVFTSGFSTFFPSNLMVGTVVEVDDNDNDYHLIRVQLGAQFAKLDHVLVVSDLLKQEQEQLIETVEKQDAANNNH